MQGELFQNAAGDFVTAFGRLVRIGGRAERDGFVGLNAPQVVAQQSGGVLLDVDFLFELLANQRVKKRTRRRDSPSGTEAKEGEIHFTSGRIRSPAWRRSARFVVQRESRIATAVHVLLTHLGK
jgi:hypothetical protein